MIDFPGFLRNNSELKICEEDIIRAFVLIRDCFKNNGKLLICGNGGSAADSEHIVSELMKGFRLKRELTLDDENKLKEAFPDDSGYLINHLQRALPAISLASHTAFMTAYANDEEPDMVFAQQVYGYGRKYDVLLALSTSGSSANVVNAVKTAKAFGLSVVGMTGRSGGKMKDLCDVCIRVPANETYHIQQYHQAIYHALCALLEDDFFGKL